MSPLKPSKPTTVVLEKCSIAEAENKGVKISNIDMFKDL